MEMSWKDPRIQFNVSNNNNNSLRLGSEILKHIWTPDFYIYKLKDIKRLQVNKQDFSA